MSNYEVEPHLYFNEDRKIINLTVSSLEPITEKTFIKVLKEFIKQYPDFNYEDLGAQIEFEVHVYDESSQEH